jgi:hypothetical protein
MPTISFVKEALHITVHNQYQNLELTTPVYFSNSTTCYVFPSQQTNIGAITKASFGIDSKQEDFKCALLYKLQRKHIDKTDNQPNGNTVSIKDITTSIHLLVIWSVEDYNHKFCVCLIELTNDFTWDEDKLWSLYFQYNDRFCEDYKSNIITWLMHDGSVMRTQSEVSYGSDYKLNIVISEGIRGNNMEETMKLDPKRLVLSL